MGKSTRDFLGRILGACILNKTIIIIPLALVAYWMILANLALRTSLAIYMYLPSHIQHMPVK